MCARLPGPSLPDSRPAGTQPNLNNSDVILGNMEVLTRTIFMQMSLFQICAVLYLRICHCKQLNALGF